MRQRLPILVLAFIMAVTSWYFVLGREKVDVWVDVPVALTGMPADMTVLAGFQNRVSVRIRGPKGLMRSLAGRTLAYTLAATDLKAGENVFTLEPTGLDLPSSFEVAELDPAVMIVRADKVISKNIAVSPSFVGSVPDTFELVESSFAPQQVTVRGAQSVLQEFETVPISPLSVNGTVFNSTVIVEGEAPLVVPPGVEARPGAVNARLVFDWKKVDKWYRVNVEPVVAEGVRTKVSPTRVRVRVRMPLPMAASKKGPALRVLARPGADAGPGKHEVLVEADAGGALVLDVEPATVTVTIRK